MKAMSAADFSGRFIHYGVREHGMAAAMNGMALHGGIIPYSGTFLVFSDYCRPAIRLAALMGKRVIHIMTHDSIGLGEDGPTHQPVEHLAALRAIPNLLVFRPCDAVETAECWQLALEAERPAERAGAHAAEPAAAAQPPRRGQYLRARRLRDRRPDGRSDVSHLRHRLRSRDRRRGAEAAGSSGRRGARGFGAVFRAVPGAPERNTAARSSAMRTVKVGVEAAIRQGWDAIIGSDGIFVGMKRFGASAPYKELYKTFRHYRRSGRRRRVGKAWERADNDYMSCRGSTAATAD